MIIAVICHVPATRKSAGQSRVCWSTHSNPWHLQGSHLAVAANTAVTHCCGGACVIISVALLNEPIILRGKSSFSVFSRWRFLVCLSSMHKRSRTCRVFVMVRFANELSVPLVPGMWTGTYSYVHNPRQHALQLRSSLSTSRTCFADRFDSRSVLLFLAQVSWKRQLLVKYAGRSPNSRACCAGTSNSQSVQQPEHRQLTAS